MPPNAHPHHARLQLLTGVGLLVFWGLFLTGNIAPVREPPGFWTFERAFVVPDTVLAFGLFAAGLLLRRGHPRGPALSLATGGALVFLGLVDLSFNIRGGVFAVLDADALASGAINAWCLGFGSALLLRFMPPSR